jgi:hypothetical protein
MAGGTDSIRARLSAGGPLLAAAGVLVALAAAAIEVRMGDEWGAGVFFVISLAAAVLVLGAGLEAAKGDGRPSGSATALIVAGLSLASSAITAFADMLGADGGSGSVTWGALLFAAVAAYPAWARRSPVSALISAISLGVAFVAGVDFVFDIEGLDTYRWLLALLAAGFAVAAARLDDGAPHRSVQLVNAAGIAILILTVTLAGEMFAGLFSGLGDGGGAVTGAPTGWEVVCLVGSAALAAYAVIRREPGPGYLAALALSTFVLAASAPGEDATLVGWPLVLIVLAGIASAAALRAPAAATDRAEDTA